MLWRRLQELLAACSTCFDPCAATAAAVPGGRKQKWHCGDTVRCCLTSNKHKCITVTVTDTGGGYGSYHRLLDFGCCYVKKTGFFDPIRGVIGITCQKIGHVAVKPNPKCPSSHGGGCGGPRSLRGCQCGGCLNNAYDPSCR